MQPNTYNLFPELEIFKSNTLKVSDTHEIYYEICGNPHGEPVVFLHGGPGSGCNPTQRRFFDPSHYFIVLIDQRGCGRSKPLGSTSENTTADLIHDIDLIRRELNIKQWHVFGGSWGSTLALSYAIKFPEQITSLILRGIFLSRQSELDWFLGDVAHFYPEVWHQLISYLPINERNDVLSAYSHRIFNDSTTINIEAAKRWNAFESAIMRLIPNEVANQEESSDELNAIEVARARVQIHYIKNQCFIDGNAILSAASTLKDIPTIIVQGRYDMVCPPKSAWELSQAMPHAEFYVVQDAGHSAMEAGVTSTLVAATEKFKALRSK
jgi:proline iminopeptidase